MATTIQLLRSDIARQRPDPGMLANGVPMVNINETEPGLFFAAKDGSLFKVGPASVGDSQPNSVAQGKQGNCLGELWIDTSGSNPDLKYFDGSGFVSAVTVPPAVTSVGLSFSSIFTVAGSPITSAGTLNVSPSAQGVNTVFAGPSSGGSAQPTFRALTAVDIPSTLNSHTFSGTATFQSLADFRGNCSLGDDATDLISFNGTVDTDVLPLATGTCSLGSNTNRWANVYTNDLNLSNEGGVNDIDGTWGSYVIQEGESDLFLINKRTGKCYKFLLQEI